MPVLPELTLGSWYFVVTCPSCQKQDAVGPAPSPEQISDAAHWEHEHRCDCGATALHKTENIRRARVLRIFEFSPSVVFQSQGPAK